MSTARTRPAAAAAGGVPDLSPPRRETATLRGNGVGRSRLGAPGVGAAELAKKPGAGVPGAGVPARRPAGNAALVAGVPGDARLPAVPAPAAPRLPAAGGGIVSGGAPASSNVDAETSSAPTTSLATQ